MKKLAFFLIIPFTLLLGTQMGRAQEGATAPASTQMKASTQQPAASARANWNAFKPETLSGTISIIEPGKKSVFVSGPGGVSYKFLVTPRTKIQIGGTTSSFNDLVSQTQKKATVTFLARPKGDIAQSITVSS